MTDELEPIHCFPTTIYAVKKPEFLDTVRLVVDEYIEKRKSEQGQPNEVYPVHMTDSLLEDQRLGDFCSYIGSTAWNILGSQGYDMPKFSTTFTEMWGQHHYKYSGMDQHVHPYGSQIIGFYFIRTPKNGSAAIFHDPRAGKVQASLPEFDMKQISGASNSINIAPEEGTMIFTNAWLPHSFSRNGSEEAMTFIHFNLGVIVNPPAEAAEVI
jgi:uncharacterized protein (TIGR02466 family)